MVLWMALLNAEAQTQSQVQGYLPTPPFPHH